MFNYGTITSLENAARFIRRRCTLFWRELSLTELRTARPASIASGSGVVIEERLRDGGPLCSISGARLKNGVAGGYRRRRRGDQRRRYGQHRRDLDGAIGVVTRGASGGVTNFPERSPAPPGWRGGLYRRQCGQWRGGRHQGLHQRRQVRRIPSAPGHGDQFRDHPGRRLRGRNRGRSPWRRLCDERRRRTPQPPSAV